tara:strand:+ start:9201 stop:9818 length:618 start_codon:yes stop_codon:yes gene_type:complete
MIKRNILNLINFKLNKKPYFNYLFVRNLIYKSIPFIITIFFIFIFFWPTIFTEYVKKKEITVSGENQKKFTFQGIDEFEQPFFLHANKYQKIFNNDNKLLFEKPKAEINLKKGKWVTMVAKKGVFDIEKQTLELIDNVLFLHSDGQQIDTNNAIIDLKKAKIYGNKKIFGKTDTVNFSSDGFIVEQEGKNFELLGKSKIKIKNLE